MVEISGRTSGVGWQFAVKDNGQGIPLDLQPSVFEPLRRLHGADIPGTGLGLNLMPYRGSTPWRSHLG